MRQTNDTDKAGMTRKQAEEGILILVWIDQHRTWVGTCKQHDNFFYAKGERSNSYTGRMVKNNFFLKMTKKTLTEPGLEPETSGVPYQRSPI